MRPRIADTVITPRPLDDFRNHQRPAQSCGVAVGVGLGLLRWRPIQRKRLCVQYRIRAGPRNRPGGFIGVLPPVSDLVVLAAKCAAQGCARLLVAAAASTATASTT